MKDLVIRSIVSIHYTKLFVIGLTRYNPNCFRPIICPVLKCIWWLLVSVMSFSSYETYFLLATGNPEGFGTELLETLVKMAPTKEEEIKLREYCGDGSKLGTAERFLKAVLEVPFAFRRVEAMLYRANFDSEVKYLRKSFQTLEVICLNFF